MRRQVALWGLPADEPLAAVRRELSRRAVPHVIIDQRGSCYCVELDAIGALFVRVCETAPLQRHLFAWADVAECFVMNRPSTMWSNWQSRALTVQPGKVQVSYLSKTAARTALLGR